MEHDIDKLKFPIGKFIVPNTIDNGTITKWIEIIQSFPYHLKKEVEELSEEALQKTYRPNGWSIRQIIHHCADSHMNSLIRFKLALTEDMPVIKPYAEDLWAELIDSKKLAINSSINILEGLHHRWVVLLQNMTSSDLAKQFRHPDSNEPINIKTNIGLYAWHCEHHLAHIKIAKMNKE
jgi:hypothetical protein